ncbi:MAG: toxin-antitoxin system HicB family antitoxin [Acidovorax sp.]|uniref:toxin-antitoxin system HicB family antitoxin n=1 Tax=Acidovorax sp. TaxID=1872122 RepID=UPI0039E383F7
MTTLSVRLPDSLHRNARLYAEREGTSLNQLLATALAEKLAALGAEDYLIERARRASDAAFAEALAQVPDVPPQAGDELPR